jgi:DNA-binding NarL/FixJ family response regulator
MAQSDPHFEIPRHSPPYNYAVDKLNRLQTDLVVSARMWAMDEVGAAIAHQLNEPLTALLIYLHQIEQAGELVPMPVRDVVGKAVHEAERVCDTLERMRHDAETSVDTRSAVARGRDAIDAWARSTSRNGSISSQPPSHSVRDVHPLTPREREVAAQITAGASNKEGGRRLGISTRTFEAHRASIMRKLGTRNTADLVRTVLAEAK